MSEIKRNVKQCTYAGVNYNSKRNSFRSQITINKKVIYLGVFKTEIEAARMYDNSIISNNLNYRLNFPALDIKILNPNTKLISLTQGMFATIDESDFARVSQFKWCAKKGCNGVYYAMRKESRFIGDGNRKSILLHRFILGVEDFTIKIDHRDHDGLNCVRSNMRECTNSQNCRNQVGRNKTSIYKGVHLIKDKKIFAVCIGIMGKKIHIGRFIDEIEAAKAYDKAAKFHFKEFAYLNFPE